MHQFYLSQFSLALALDASHNDQIDTSAKETVFVIDVLCVHHVHHVHYVHHVHHAHVHISSPVPPSNPGWPDNQRNGSHRCNGSDRQGNLRGNYVESRIFKRQKNILG